ncbi:MAG: oxidoreductase [Chloroflexi bacterium]|jgi:predicted ferric reductase|nr:ferric reductase-like transmembrane domain-containing protein [Anaerolineaceae bacterium]NMB89304.1 oxidoreductase [Chloroflexota bacterium]
MTTNGVTTKLAQPGQLPAENLALKQALWIVVYFGLILSPLFLLIALPHQAGREFYRDFSVALGYVGLAMMGLQLVPTARLPFLANVFHMDTLYSMHHRLSVLSFLLILSHPLILLAFNPKTLVLLNVFNTPQKTVAGVLGLLGLLLIVFSSVLRKELKINYDVWKVAHSLLTIGICVAALVHIFGMNYYTAAPEQRALWIGMAALWAVMLLYVRVITPLRLMQTPYEVAEIRPECNQTYTLSLRPLDHARMNFKPGQVAWITSGRSPFAYRKHPFSISSSAENGDRLEFSIKELGDFTTTIKDLQPGSKVYVDGPYGVFDVERCGQCGLVLIAGGIGAAPVMSILRTLADRRDKRPVYFFYGNLDEECIIFGDDIAALEKRLNMKVIHVLERPTSGCWEGECGYITHEILEKDLPGNASEMTYFLCGPLPMIQSVENSLAAMQVPPANVYSERYDMA